MAISLRTKNIWRSNIINRIDKRIHDLRCSHIIELSHRSPKENEQEAKVLSDAAACLSARREQLSQEILSITTQSQLDAILDIVVTITSDPDNPFIDEPLPFFADE